MSTRVPMRDPPRAWRHHEAIEAVPASSPGSTSCWPPLAHEAEDAGHFGLAMMRRRVEQAGGAVLLPRTELPDGMGVFAQIRDSEGNRVGLYSMA